MARKPYVKAKAMQGRGHLQSVATDGPHVEWLGHARILHPHLSDC